MKGKVKREKHWIKPLEDFETITRLYEREIDDPLSLELMARLRAAEVLNDEDWSKVLGCLNDTMAFLAVDDHESTGDIIDIDADPRNSAWLRILRTNKLTGYNLPHWAVLWLGSIGFERKGEPFWRSVGEVASEMGLERFR